MTPTVVVWSLWVLILFQLLAPIQAAGPAFSGLPTDIYVGALETGTRPLYIFDITDANADSFSCTVGIDGELAGASATDLDNEFVIKKNTQDGYYELWSNAATYDVTIIDTFVVGASCTDSNSETSVGNNEVRVIVVDKASLTINNVEGAANDLTVDALGTAAETPLKTVSTTVTGGGTIECSMTTEPTHDPPFFTIDNSTCEIRTTWPTEFLDSADTTVKATIIARDTSTNIRYTSTQTIHMTNQNTLPRASNMITPLTRTELETLASGTVLFTIDVEDPDTQSHTFRYECTPDVAKTLFEVAANGEVTIATGQSLDYETITPITCDFYIHDGIEENGPFTYVLTVANDNEAPVFSEAMYYVTTPEGLKGAVSFDPGLVCTDPDASDIITYEIRDQAFAERFFVDSAGIMTFNSDYDVDGFTAHTTSEIVGVCCIDSGHITGAKKSSCAEVTVTITDANDNEPIFSSPTYMFTVDQTVTPGSLIGQLVVTDIDGLSNGQVACPTKTSTSANSACYTIGADCNVYLSCTPTFASGTYVEYTVYATDDGDPQKTGTAAVGLIYQETTTTTTATTTTTEKYNFFDHGVNIFLFVLSLLMGLLLLGLLTWCCMRLCCGGACGGRGAMCRNMCDCGYQGRAKRSNRHQHRRAVTPDSDSPRQRTRIKEEPARKIIQEQRPIQVIRSVGHSPYANLRQVPMKYPVRSAPLPPGYFP